jgi:hypothetical protein
VVLKAVTMKITVFWEVVPYRLLDVYPRFIRIAASIFRIEYPEDDSSMFFQVSKHLILCSVTSEETVIFKAVVLKTLELDNLFFTS